MSTGPLLSGAPATPCRVLVVDDDRRVRELLEVTLTTHGFTVLTAADGEEALMRARRERPDLILLDVRLPRRSGLEVCDALRNDPTDPAVPIILITAAAETEHRLQGFLRGADDVMAKPFSPKELVARMRRLLARATETRTSARRARELERELQSAGREARHSDEEARREQSRLEAASGPGRELLALLDLDALLERLLGMTQLKLRSQAVAALVADAAGAPFRAHAVRGERFERAASLSLGCTGELASLLRGLARPVRVADLERLGADAAEIGAIVRGRWDLLVPVVSCGELEAVLLSMEPGLREADTRAAWDELAVVGEFAGVALRNARRVREQGRWLLAIAAERTYRGSESATAMAEARQLLDRCARALHLSPAEREHVRHALALGDWARTAAGARELDGLCASDASGLAQRTRALIDACASEPDADTERAVVLLVATEAYRAARARGLDAPEAIGRACARAAVDPAVADCLASLAVTPFDPERDAA